MKFVAIALTCLLFCSAAPAFAAEPDLPSMGIQATDMSDAEGMEVRGSGYARISGFSISTILWWSNNVIWSQSSPIAVSHTVAIPAFQLRFIVYQSSFARVR